MLYVLLFKSVLIVLCYALRLTYDYYNSDNEGHMFVKLTNDSNEDKSLSLTAGQGMVQGIFFEFGIVEDDDVTEERNGGFGSTTK